MDTSAPTAPAVTVLVVDDEAFMRAYLRDALAKDGHRVVEAGGADEALVLAARERPRLILLDLLMPDRSGLEVIARLGEASPGAVVVVVSSMEEDGVVELARAAGAADFLPKPFHPVELEEAVRRALAGGES